MSEKPETEDAALAAFTEYFRKNYPGPDTIIGRPDWHAPKIFRAARRALFTPAALAASPEVQAMIREAEARGMERAAGRGIYVASKAKYGPEWVAMREAGVPIIASWIDESGVGETVDWPGLWVRCIDEASSASALVLVCRGGDILKGAFVEAGAALACGVPVFATGIDAFSIKHHPGVTMCATEAEAFRLAIRAEAAAMKGAKP